MYVYILCRGNCLDERKNKQRSKQHSKVNLTLCTKTVLEVCKTCCNINQLLIMELSVTSLSVVSVVSNVFSLLQETFPE